jgi:tRNA pseudouridine38-40 synthase
MPGNYDLSLLMEAVNLLKGEHDFLNFSTPEKGRTSKSKIEKIDIRGEKEFIVIDIRANYFLWHMVRKIAAALKLVGSGRKDVSWIGQMLEPEQFTEALEPAPAYGLVLLNVEYGNITWKEDAYAKNAISENLEERFLMHGVMAEMLREFKDSMTVYPLCYLRLNFQASTTPFRNRKYLPVLKH